MKTKVCIVSPYVSDCDIVGQITIFCNKLARDLAQDDALEITFCDAGCNTYIEEDVQNNYGRYGIKYFSIRDYDFDTSSLLTSCDELAASVKIEAWLRERHFDMVHFQDYSGSAFCCIRNKRVRGFHRRTHFVLYIHHPILFVSELNKTYLPNPKVNYMERYCAQHADTLAVINSSAFNLLKKQGWIISSKPVFLEIFMSPEHGSASSETLLGPKISQKHCQKVAPQNTLPLISVCMPHYNHGAYLPMALESLYNQTYENMEVLVVDDGSSYEKSKQVFEQMKTLYASNPKWRFVVKQNSGPEKCRNYAAELAKGEFLVFMDSDNVATATMVENLAAGIFNSKADCVSCWFYGFSSKNFPDTVDYIYATLGACVELGWDYNCFGDVNFIIRKQVFEKLNGFTASQKGRGNEDWEFLANLCLAGYDLDVVMEPLFWYRNLPEGYNRATNVVANMKRVVDVYDRYSPKLLNTFQNVVIPLKDRYEIRIQDYENRVKGYENRVKGYENRIQDYETRVRDYEIRNQDYESRVRDYEIRNQDYENRVNEYETILLEHDRRAQNPYNRIGRGLSKVISATMGMLPGFCESAFLKAINKISKK